MAKFMLLPAFGKEARRKRGLTTDAHYLIVHMDGRSPLRDEGETLIAEIHGARVCSPGYYAVPADAVAELEDVAERVGNALRVHPAE